ncbi:MAG: SDR family oxidoreductase [Chloroflexota bacterium]
MNKNSLLENKVAIITGASRGIGRATALLLAEAGASVVLVARSANSIQALADEIKGNGGNALAIPTDVTNQADVDLLITMTMRAFRQVDILINNAGVLHPIGKTWEVSPQAWENLMRINVLGPYFCARAILPHMLERGDGRIINVSSGAAYKNIVGWGAYCASKAALDRFTGVLAEEVSDTNVVVTAFNPGTTDTQMQADIRQTTTQTFPNGDFFRQLHETGKLFKPEEPAQLILWLASEFGEDKNGQIFDFGDPETRDVIAQELAI